MFHFFKNRQQNTKRSVSAIEKQEDFSDIASIADYFKTLTGVTFESQESILRSKLISFCRNRDIYSFSDCLQKARSDRSFNQHLINYLTTNESYFYRELAQIKELANKVAALSATVDILCAPCSTGEESYSLVMALLEVGVPYKRFNILGIDINSEAIERAQLAVYNQRNISNIPAALLEKYFVREFDKYRLKSNIKNLVRFQQANIFDSSFASIGRFDYIFSRNMLIYFDAATKLKAKGILEGRLKSSANTIYFGHADLF